MPSFRRLLILTLGLFAVLIPANASAHTTLASSIPSNNSTVAVWPVQVELTFAEPLQTLGNEKINFVTVSNSNGDQVSTGAAIVQGDKVIEKLQPNTVQGLVLVNYRVAAQDGHVVDGEFTFTYGKGSGVTPSPIATATENHSHSSNSRLGIYAGSTTLIVIALLFGLWAYRKS